MGSVPPTSDGDTAADDRRLDVRPFEPTLGHDLHARHRLRRATFTGRGDGPLAAVPPGRTLGHLAHDDGVLP